MCNTIQVYHWLNKQIKVVGILHDHNKKYTKQKT